MRITLESDNVFSDGAELQMGTFTGNPKRGYVGSLSVYVGSSSVLVYLMYGLLKVLPMRMQPMYLFFIQRTTES